MEGFLLGLSMGFVCMGYCGPILIPYMLGEGKTVGRNFIDVGLFLAGRLVGYVVFGVLAWVVGITFTPPRMPLLGLGYIVLSGLLLFYTFSRVRSCSCEPLTRQAGSNFKLRTRWPFLVPVLGGLVTGLSLCHPFLLAFLAAANKRSLTASVFFFLMFFSGTSVFFLLLPLTGCLRRVQALKIVGRLAVGIVGVLYMYRGVILMIGGLVSRNE